MDAGQEIIIIRSHPRYAEAMQALSEAVYGYEASEENEIFTAAQYRHHIQIFPEGQFTALVGRQVIGLTVSMRIDFDPAHPFIESWWKTVNNGWLNHKPDGEWMYGVESVVHPNYQGRGIGGKLMEARYETARRLNLRGMVAGSALVSYAKVAHLVSPEEYVRGVVEGRFFDNNLTKQLRKGFKVGALIPNYVDDKETLGWGAVIIWENPDYNPTAKVARRRIGARRYRMPLRPPYMAGSSPML
ncbi:MAG TPA: GNAT family N-acetyltransferase [Oceanobacillus sp.]|nr:GNAT family N-acetyltransferase [Oceanobacillus sp.]